MRHTKVTILLLERVSEFRKKKFVLLQLS